MEIDINNAFIIAVKTSFEPCLVKYHEVSAIILDLSKILIKYFLKKPFLTTTLFLIFIIFLLSVLSMVFVTIFGVLVFVLIIILIEGFLLITCLIMIFMILLNFLVIMIVIIEIKCKMFTES